MIENPTEAPEATKEPFVIDSEDRASWLVRKLAGIRAEQERIKSATETRLQELDSDYNSLWSHFGPQLESWAMGEAEKRRRKTITLPLAGASVAFRTVAGALRPTKDGGKDRADIALTLGFSVTPDPVADLKRYEAHAQEHFASTGEALTGYEFVESRENFTIDFGGKAKKKKEETE